jgi:hydrogenase-4 component F
MIALQLPEMFLLLLQLLHQLLLRKLLLLLILLSVIFYRFVAIYQSMKYEGETVEKKVHNSELFALVIFAVALLALITPASMAFLRSIA